VNPRRTATAGRRRADGPTTPGSSDALLLGEWACLGILYERPSHGFAVAARLTPGADVGRVWSSSRSLTYRSLDQLVQRGLVVAVGEERGVAGGTRTVLAATRHGRAMFRRWLHSPVVHLRDVRSELLLKIVLASANDIDVSATIRAQRERAVEFVEMLDRSGDDRDIVHLWRRESAEATVRFLDRLGAASTP
jgi:PadR family transcriptional regulator AphA